MLCALNGRICRPGSIVGPQQQFLMTVEARLIVEGERFRERFGRPKNQLAALGFRKNMHSGADSERSDASSKALGLEGSIAAGPRSKSAFPFCWS